MTSARGEAAGDLEVEFAVAGAEWVSSRGAMDVARGGKVALLDRDGLATVLAEHFVESKT